MTDNPNPTPPSRLRGALALLAREDVQQRLPALIETIFSLVTLIIQRVRAARAQIAAIAPEMQAAPAPPPPPPEPARRRSFPLLTVIGAGLGAWATVKVFQEMQVRQNPHYFEGKVVLITGASRGLGRAYAHGFARRGSHLILAARNEDQLNEVAAECRDLNVQIETLVVPTDVTNHAHLEALVRLAPVRSAPLRSAPTRLACCMATPLSVAKAKFAFSAETWLRSAPLKSAPASVMPSNY